MQKQRDLVKSELETFDREVKDFYAQLKRQGIYSFDYGFESALSLLKEDQEAYNIYFTKYSDFEYFSKMLYDEDEQPNSLSTSSKNLELVKQEIDAMIQLWQHIETCDKKCNEYLNMEWSEVKPSIIGEDIKNIMIKPLNNFKKIDKKCSAFKDFQKKLKSWEAFIALIGELKKKSMTVEDDRHWNELKEFLGTDFTVEDSLKLEHFYGLEIYDPKTKEKIEDIALKADQEQKIEQQLNDVDNKWKFVEFESQPLQLKDVKLEVLKVKDDDVETLEQHQLLIQTISASKYMSHFKDIVEDWQKNLAAINDTITLLAEVQKTWSFLINLFRYSEEVKKELPKETQDFAVVDKEVERLLSLSKRKDLKNVLKYCIEDYDDYKVLNKLTFISNELAKCQKGLNNFIAEKRKVFPRFYFLTMEELLDILANGNNPKMLFM